MTDINEFQYEQYFQFKSLLLQKKVLSNFDEYDTLFLLKFLRARKFDLNLTLKMFQDYLVWRNSINLEEIRERDFPQAEKLMKVYPRFYHKTDKLGRPIYIELVSKTKYEEIFTIISEDDLISLLIKDYEYYLKFRLPMCSKVKGTPIEQSLTILCVKDVSLKFALTVKSFLQKNFKVSQDYYPEMLGHLFIVNAPFVFKAIWALIKGFIDEKTKKKTSIEGSDFLPKLKELVDEENLPKYFGGKCECRHLENGCIGSDIGPWNPYYS